MSRHSYEVEYKRIGAPESEIERFKSAKKAKKFAHKLNKNRTEYWILFYLANNDNGTSGILESYENEQLKRS